MQTRFKPPFKSFVKKQSRPFQLAIEDEVEKITDNIELGEKKKGDLSEFRIHKFSFKRLKLLLAYRWQGNKLFFYMIGPHENFYNKLKRYIREVDQP